MRRSAQQLENKAQTILLCAGKINYVNLPVSTNTSNSMIPVNGKPVISWILEDLLRKEIKAVTIVLRAEDSHLKEFLNRSFQTRIQLTLVEMTSSNSILESLNAGLEKLLPVGLVRIILGDTLIQDSFESKDNFLYIQEVEDSTRWCLAETDANGYVLNYIEKKSGLPKPHYALAGYYHLQDGKYFTQCVHEALEQNYSQLSDALLLYQREYPMQSRWAKNWFDFGNVDNLIHAKQRLLQSRYFNTLTIDPVLNTITKVSEFDEKLRNELNWYESLPDKLKVLTPRIVSKEQKNGQLHLVQEYYGYPTLSELYLYSDLNIDNWASILRKLLDVHLQLTQFKGNVSETDLLEIYLTKTFSRIDTLVSSDPCWEQILNYETIYINEEAYSNFYSIKQDIIERATNLVRNTSSTIIHGDYCFSNILFDINNQIVRLIDPRGSFGSIGIYGDPRYDIAKLRHSVAGLYDYIISDQFHVTTEGNAYSFTVYTNEIVTPAKLIFDEIIKEAGYNIEEIQLIEALLFLSMLPLHKDKPNRQLAMYLTSIKLLKTVYACVS